MAPTRSPQIWQDATALDQENVQSDQHGLHDPTLNMVSKGCNEMGTDHDAIFNPPSSASSGRSPLKPVLQPSTTPRKASIPNIHVPLPPPRPNLFKTDSPPKRSYFGALPPVPHPKIPLAMFGSFPSSRVADKENNAPNIHSENVAEFSEPPFEYEPSLKRSLCATGQIPEKEAKQTRHDNRSHFELPEPQTLPKIVDDGNKPQYSYASLIGMAILRSPERKLTLAQIYKWISDSFAHYRKANDSGWQNSIRHNLSLNKAFIKQERPKDDPGKGNYWAIKPGCESQFFHKEKGSRRPHSSSTAQKALSQNASSETSSLPVLPAKASSSAPNARTEEKEPSSDATIPASDAPSSIEDEDAVLPRATTRESDYSPILEMRSSPPTLPTLHHDQLSPAPHTELPALTKADRKKRKRVEMDDSGYFSSLDSSVTRPGPEPKLPRFDSHIKKIRRGRAEEEIARMRSSSHDVSPTKIRSFMKQPTPSLASSSPLRSLDTALMPPPLTPAVTLKLPLKPPPSVSPSTNLRIHRENIRQLLGSPANKSPGDDNFPSPAFKLPEDELYGLDDGNENGYGFFNSGDRYSACRPMTSSPLKKSVRRTDRARTSSNVLADVTGIQSNKLSARYGGAEAVESPLRQKSQRSPLRFGSSLEDKDEVLFGVNLSDFEDLDDSGGFDLTQGFAKIGSQTGPVTTGAGHPRPKLGGRSQTSRF